MANKLLKKSFLLKNLKEVSYDNLWNTKGVFTTIRIKDNSTNLIFFKEHIKNLNLSLKKINIKFKLNLDIFNNLIKNDLENKLFNNHLLRIAINSKKISFDLRKRLKYKKNFKGILVTYKRPQPEIKNLYYKKVLLLLNSINSNFEEIIFCDKKNLLEGCTTNIICVKKNKLYIPKNNFYFGISLRIIKKFSFRKISQINISINDLNSFDEILLVGTGKGVVSINNIPQIKWKQKSQFIYKEVQALYNSLLEKRV
tara:strand:+ start:99 stop:863 length:765 start_codon:yes stop_codon:yes gene_type:complete